MEVFLAPRFNLNVLYGQQFVNLKLVTLHRYHLYAIFFSRLITSQAHKWHAGMNRPVKNRK